ncbi:MAG: glycosyltransferase [Candidatus Nanopelagicaceae bacterium]
MNISYYTIKAGLNPNVGFGYAGQNIVKSLNELGHKVSFANPKSEVQLNFTQPHQYKLHRNQYQIGYTPWESTKIRHEWKEIMNACDEVWATSDWVADVYKNNGITKPIYVYPHGIESIWSPKKRVQREGRPLKFLHVGEPSPRKDGQLVVESFIKLFGNNPEYQLTIKAQGFHTVRIYHKDQLVVPEDIYTNIKVITEDYPIERLVSLYHEHDVLVYPTWGEGFGFIPLQGLATGMPVISTYDWAHYKKFLGPLKLNSRLTDAEVEGVPKAVGDPHIGQFYKPDRKHLEDQMVYAALNFKAMSGYYYAQSTKIHEEYNWIELTKNAFKHLEEKF